MLQFLPPVDAPALILVGLNYTDHAAEVSLQLPQLPVIFGKAASSITGHKGRVGAWRMYRQCTHAPTALWSD